MDTQQTPHQSRVEQFMTLAKQEVKTVPSVPSDAVVILRAKLLIEECIETLRSLGVSLQYKLGLTLAEDKKFLLEIDLSKLNYKKDVEYIKTAPTDIVGVADGAADISVVNIGMLSAFGIKDKALLEEVDANNLAKFGEGHSFREDGKLIKPPNHRPPNIVDVLKKQGYSPNHESDSKT